MFHFEKLVFLKLEHHLVIIMIVIITKSNLIGLNNDFFCQFVQIVEVTVDADQLIPNTKIFSVEEKMNFERFCNKQS